MHLCMALNKFRNLPGLLIFSYNFEISKDFAHLENIPKEIIQP